jgi:hypothetical protein
MARLAPEFSAARQTWMIFLPNHPPMIGMTHNFCSFTQPRVFLGLRLYQVLYQFLLSFAPVDRFDEEWQS